MNIYKLPDQYDRAILRQDPDGIYIYQAEAVIEILEEDMEHDEAVDWYFYNMEGTAGNAGYPRYEWDLFLEEDEDDDGQGSSEEV